MTERPDWTCPKCGLGAEKHNLSLAMLHIYGDVPKKDGTPLTREDTDEMQDRILGKVAEDFGLEPSDGG